VYGLFDYDPDGIGIFHTYKYGSARAAHEPCNAACPDMKWLGLKSCNAFVTNEQSERSLMQLSFRDRRRANRMLSWPAFTAEDTCAATVRRELQVMLFMSRKAEIQLLEAFPGGLGTRLEMLCLDRDDLSR
jgi:meiotic recombination protein SPO11